ncbi:MAG: hypothetical protein U1G05_17800 [Kiritimatiellia bacterium]
MPLNHLGLVLDYHNVRDGLPAPESLAGVRGVLIWFDQGRCSAGPEALLAWCEGVAATGRKLVVIGDLPLETALGCAPVGKDRLVRFWSALGLRWADNSVDITYDVEVLHKSPALVEFERPLPPDLPPFAITRAIGDGAVSHLRVRKKGDPATESDLVVTSPAGGYIAANYLGYQDQDGTFLQLYVNPFEFFRAAFGTDDLPKPDVTTLSGGRIYYSHIDGDGWRSESAVPGYKERNASSAEVIYREAILPYPDLPVTVGPIVGDIDPAWYGNRAEMRLARDLFALPHVEPGTHTYTHPLNWAAFSGQDIPPEPAPERDENEGRPIPDDEMVSVFGSGGRVAVQASGAPGAPDKSAGPYERPSTYARGPFRMEREVGESIAFINNLCPPGKQVRLLQWSGNCCPFEAALRQVKLAGVRNINGGDSRFDAEFPSCLWVAPVGRQIGGLRQIFASNSNELTYTDLWTARFFAFRNLAETVRNTDSPRRLSAFNLYYHMYSGERVASLAALKSNLDFARGLKLTPIAASHYAGIADGFFSAQLVPDGPGSWWIEGRDLLQTVRFDDADHKAPRMDQCKGVLGFTRHQGSLYVALDPAVERPRVEIQELAGSGSNMDATRPELEYSRWPVEGLDVKGRAWSFDAAGYGGGEMVWRVPEDGPFRVVLSQAGRMRSDTNLQTRGKTLRIPLPGNDPSTVHVEISPGRESS